MKADVITNDKCVIECCHEEKIDAFNHRNVAVPEKKRPPKTEQKVAKNKRWTLDEIDQEFDEKGNNKHA